MAGKRMGAATVSDVALDVEGADPVEAFVVEPRARPQAGILFLHWLGEHHNDRTQFLTEARALAELGVRSVLPAGRLPWLVPPTDAETDAANIELEGRRLDRAFAELAAPLGKKVPLAIVGHDFGAMHGTLLAAREPRVKALVVVAAPPRWADWFLPFWPIVGDPIDYRRLLAPLDPTTALPKTRAELLFQFSARDFYLSLANGRELARAAARDVTFESYQADHAMRSSRARAARATFLRRTLRLD
ncbi:MAG TPA: alpha/beta fold hydrolase [Candidatus Limnocylindrales bacterium]|nr:alpha/beta fold hydrolase [Candidatus Limnocylindrales bacterium]